MHTDARTLPHDALIEGDLCIVGAGAAGIAMALEWVDRRQRVILLEGGGFDYEPPVQDRYRGEIVGQPYYPLERARLHFFGGTTGHWAGFCSPFDPVDFESRDWVAHSGWPFPRETLDPYYARAQEVLELGPYAYEAPFWMDRDPDLRELPLDPGVVWTKMWQFSPPTRFGTRYREPLVRAPDVHLLTHATVAEIEVNESATAVSQLRTRGLDGKGLRVRARFYVLACGAIQNARLLLASRRQVAAGLGNAHDLVGRFFMEHLELPVAELVLARPEPMKLYHLQWGYTRARGEIAFTPAAQRRLRSLNGTFELAPGAARGDLSSTFQQLPPEVLEQIVERERRIAGGEIERPTVSPEAITPQRWFTLGTRSEQAPNPDSRVTLATEADAIGMPRARLDWRLMPQDKQSIRELTLARARVWGRAGVGRVRAFDWLFEDDHAWPGFLSGGWHHMGTTRMDPDPRRGVVDADARIHGIPNLYIAGSSVFPTGGAANPTLTLVALALRLSDHLRERLTAGPVAAASSVAAGGAG